MNRPALILAASVGLGVSPMAVQAHLVNSGLGPFYDGALHLLLSPGDVLALTAVALLAGLRGHRAGRLAVMVLPVAWLLAGGVGLHTVPAFDLSWVSTGSLVGVGALVALDPKAPPPVVALIAGGVGGLHGLANGASLSAVGAGGVSLLGIVGTAAGISLLLAAAVVSLEAPWTRICVRVAGSWMAAIGMLMFGWLLRSAS